MSILDQGGTGADVLKDSYKEENLEKSSDITSYERAELIKIDAFIEALPKDSLKRKQYESIRRNFLKYKMSENRGHMNAIVKGVSEMKEALLEGSLLREMNKR